MLLHLEISNVALIDRISIDFEAGLNILTGETGAGKSIIIDSINALLGQRTSREIIRTGEEKANVEGIFLVNKADINRLLEEYGIQPEEDGTLLLSREFTLSGRNICRANGKIITVSALKEIGERLIDVHGQHDTQSLFYPENHLRLLDAFGGEKIEALKKSYNQYFEEYERLYRKLRELSGDASERERKIDLMNYEINEIESARLRPGEEEELKEQRLLIANAEKILSSLQDAYEMLYTGAREGNSAIDSINGAIARIGSILNIKQEYRDMYSKLTDILYLLEDVTHDIRAQKDNISFDEGLLEQVEKRIDLINNLKRKYGKSIEEILKYCSDTKQKLDEILNNEEIVRGIEKDMSELKKKLIDIARKLYAERMAAALVLENSITEELKDLEMAGARFKVNIINSLEEDEDNIELINYRNGFDRAEFLISPNRGEPLKELARIASGGELSRVMLAIKKILADVDEIPTLIFDEIDMGISGRTAIKVGEKLKFISGSHQVICVTHLAQIASMADRNFKIEKVVDEERTLTRVMQLTGDDLLKEIARIMGGMENSAISLKHAEELVSKVRKQ